MKLYVMICVVALISMNARPCDVCGGGGIAGAGLQGLTPTNGFHFIAMQSGFSQFQNGVAYNGAFYLSSNQYFFRNSLVGRFQFSDKIAAIATLPFVYTETRKSKSTIQNNGIGDIRLDMNYLLINQKKEGQSHLLRIGGGVKLPTGNYSKTSWQSTNVFPGTGSYDFNVSSNYVFSKNKWGIIQENSYVITTENPYEYRFGNALASSASYYYKLQKTNTVWIPFSGIDFQLFQTDKIQQIPFYNRSISGYIIALKAGAQLKIKNWLFNAQYAHPVKQHILNGNVRQVVGKIELKVIFLIQRK